jgi:hypothetical protein
MSKKLRLRIVLALMSTLAIGLMANEAFAAGVQVVVYPANVIQQIPANDAGSDGGPVYRANNTNAMNAPFVIVVRVVGYYDGSNDRIRLWLDDNQDGGTEPTVQTYDRFDGSANKNLGGALWLAESTSAPAGLDWTNITSNVFYVMAIGRIASNAPAANPTYTVYWEVDDDGNGTADFNGSAAAGGASTLLTANQQDWYLNWNDTDPESGDSVTADYVELFDDSFNSVTTAPVDASGYFQAVMPDGASGDWLAEARSESGAIQRTWVTSISQTTTTYNELLNAGTGAPTVVTLSDVTAESPNLWVGVALAALALVGVGGAALLLRRRRIA